MSDTDDMRRPEDARAALAAAARMTAAGLRRGLCPRWFAAVFSAWFGGLVALTALDGPMARIVFLAVAVCGVLWLAHFRSRSGAWLREVNTNRDAAIVLVASVALLAVIAGGYFLKHGYGLAWGPVLAGAVVSGSLFVLMELSYRTLRARLAAARPEEHRSTRPDWFGAALALLVGAAFAAPAAVVWSGPWAYAGATGLCVAAWLALALGLPRAVWRNAVTLGPPLLVGAFAVFMVGLYLWALAYAFGEGLAWPAVVSAPVAAVIAFLGVERRATDERI